MSLSNVSLKRVCHLNACYSVLSLRACVSFNNLSREKVCHLNACHSVMCHVGDVSFSGFLIEMFHILEGYVTDSDTNSDTSDTNRYREKLCISIYK